MIASSFKKKIILKYLTMFLLISTYIPLVVILLVLFANEFTFPNEKIYDNLLIMFFAIFILAMISYALYSKIATLPSITSISEIKEYLCYFRDTKIKHYIYVETITWFSKLVRAVYLQKTSHINNNNYADCINLLYQILRPNNKGLCEAVHHQKAFAQLSSSIIQSISNNSLQNDKSNINNEIEHILTSSPEEPYRRNKDRNMTFYIMLITAHVAGCLLVAEIFTNFSLSIFLGNIFLYIPADIGLIIAYKDIIKKV